jgi:hypothetical protein
MSATVSAAIIGALASGCWYSALWSQAPVVANNGYARDLQIARHQTFHMRASAVCFGVLAGLVFYAAGGTL